MSKTRIGLLDEAELDKRLAYYARRNDLAARLIFRLIEDCRWYRGLLAAREAWAAHIESSSRPVRGTDGTGSTSETEDRGEG